MFQILSYHLFRDVAGAPRPVPDGPEVLAPVPLLPCWKLTLQNPRRAPFQSPDKLTYRLRWRVLDQHVDMIAADHTFEDADIFGIADLQNQPVTSFLDLACEHMVTILGRPDDIHGQARDRMAAITIFSHLAVLARREVCSN